MGMRKEYKHGDGEWGVGSGGGEGGNVFTIKTEI